MKNDYVAPIDHSTLSAAGSVTAGGIGGALKKVFKSASWLVGGGAILGAVALLAIPVAIAGWAGIGAAFLAAPFWMTIGTGLIGTVGGLMGGTTGALATAFASPIVATVGAVKGAGRAQDQVNEERAAAKMMEMQLAAYQSQQASNDNKYNFPPQGSHMNPAMAQIDAGSAQANGMVAGQQLQRA